MRDLLLALVLGWCSVATAAPLRGTVQHVTDGDSVWVKPERGGPPLEVRLLHLDAPEGCQRHGAEARAALAGRVLRQRVVLHPVGHDDYRRLLATVEHRGEDVGAWLVRSGHAWASRERRQPGPYAALQSEARRRQRGLWAEPRPTEPRAFRREHGPCGH